LGDKITKTFVVKQSETADAIKSGKLPVLSTPYLIAYMENTTWEGVEEELGEGYTTVGSYMDVKHLAPTGVDQEMKIVSNKSKKSEKMYSFRIEAYAGDNKIGEANHDRVVVEEKSFMRSVQ